MRAAHSTSTIYYNNSLLQTRGLYKRDHRHKSTKNGEPHSSALQNRFCTWPTWRGAKHFIITTTVLSFTRAQKMVSHRVAQCRSMFAHDQLWEEQNTLTALLTYVSLVCTHCPHIFLQHKSNSDEMWTPKQLSNNHCNVFQPSCCSGTFRKCLCCSWNPMRWSKCLYCYNRTELWLRISSLAISVCFGPLAATRGTPVEKHWTTAFGLHHTGALNNWGKMKICKKHQIFEAIE